MTMKRKTKPAVSVVFSAGRAPENAAASLESLWTQDCADCEILCVAPRQEKAFAATLQKYAQSDKRIQIIESKKPDIAALRNECLKKAQGAYIAFFTGDAVWDNDCLSHLCNRADLTQADVIQCDFYPENANQTAAIDKSTAEFISSNPALRPADIAPCFFQAFDSSLNNKLFKKSFLLKHSIRFSAAGGDIFVPLAAGIAARTLSIIKQPCVKITGAAVPPPCPRKYECWRRICDAMKEKKLWESAKHSLAAHAIGLFLAFQEETPEPIRTFQQSEFLTKIAPLFELHDLGKSHLPKDIWDKWHKINTAVVPPQFKTFYTKKKTSIVPIVFTANEHYFLPLCVAIQSVVEHADPAHFYDIYVLCNKLAPDIVSIIESFAAPNIRVACVSIASCLPANIKLYAKAYYSREMYYRWLIPNVVAYEKVLYLDCDIVAVQDVAKLYREDLGRFAIAGVRNYANIPFQNYIAKKRWDGATYINTGVLLMNTALFKANNIAEKCFAFIQENQDLNCPDQDALNAVCKNQIKLLNPAWNCLWQPVISDKYQMNAFSEPELENWHRNSFAHARLIHYNTHIKPWLEPANELAAIWWRYARKSPVYHMIIDKYADNALKKNAESAVKKPLGDIEGMSHFNTLFMKSLKVYILSKFSSSESRKKYLNELNVLKKEMNQQYKKVVHETPPKK